MIFTSYIAYLHLENGKKIRINKTFGTKAEAQKELKIAEKELKSVVGIAKYPIVIYEIYQGIETTVVVAPHVDS